MSGSLRGIVVGVLRNWGMLAAAILAVMLAFSSSGGWIRLVAIALVAIGVALNLVAIFANAGRMPVHMDEIPSSHESGYEIMGDNTRLWFLGDWISVRDWLISPGDVCLFAGLVIGVAARLVGHFVEST